MHNVESPHSSGVEEKLKGGVKVKVNELQGGFHVAITNHRGLSIWRNGTCRETHERGSKKLEYTHNYLSTMRPY